MTGWLVTGDLVHRVNSSQRAAKWDCEASRQKPRVDPSVHPETPISPLHSILTRAKFSNLGPCMVSAGSFNSDEAPSLWM